MTEQNLRDFIWNRNGTNYTIYNNSLLLTANFDNVSAIGDNETHAVDISGKGSKGTLTNGAFYNISGMFGSSVQFDGSDDYIDHSRIPGLENANSNYTVNLWVRKATTSTTTSIFYYDRNANLGGDSSNRDIYLIHTDGSGLRWGIITGCETNT